MAAGDQQLIRVRRRRRVKRSRWRWLLDPRRLSRRTAIVLGVSVLLVVLGLVTYRYVQAMRELQRGRDDLLAAETILRSGGPSIQVDQLEQAKALLEDAQRALGPDSSVIADGWVSGAVAHLPILDRQVQAVRSLRIAGESGADLALALIPFLNDVRAAGGGGGSGTVSELVDIAGKERSALDRATTDLNALDSAIDSMPSGSLIGPLDHVRSTALQARERVDAPLKAALGIVRVLPAAAGSGQHRYLLLLTNPGEERGGGGFIGAVGLLSFSDGKLLSSDFLPGEFANLLVKDIPAPQPIDAITHTALTLPDSGWAPDFPTSAALAAQFYTRATGTKVDGVVSVDPVALGYVLRVTGAVHVPPYPQVVTADNALLELNYIINSARASDPGKAYLAPFGHAMVDLLFKTPKSGWTDLATALQRSVSEKHIVLNFNDRSLQKLVIDGNAGGVLSAVEGDGVLVADSNMSGTKGDLYVKRTYSLVATVGATGNVQDRLTMTYRNPQVANPADAALVINSNGFYEDYLRVYLPTSATIGGLLVSENGGAPQSTSPEDTGTESGRQWIAYRLLLPVDGTTAVTLDYSGPSAHVDAPGRVSYDLSWQKQNNALTWPITVDVHMPDGSSRHWDSDLGVDRRWSLTSG